MIGSEHRRSDRLHGRHIPTDVLCALPKTDLLCHLDGSLRIGTFRELAGAEGLDVPADDQATLDHYFPVDTESCRRHFEGFFEHTTAVLQTPESLTRVARELAEDAADQGCWYLEVRFCPLHHRKRGMTLDESVAAVHAGLEQVEQDKGIRTGIIITGIRTIGPDASLELAELAVSWKGCGVVAFDLAGTEKDYPAKLHREAFYYMMNNNMSSTIHAGEGFGPESIHQAIHYCGANRIGHGTRLHEDQDLLAYVNDMRIPLEMSLTSEVLTGVVPTVGDHPLRHYLDLGLRVTLNTDNMLFTRSSLCRELRLAVDAFDLNLLETETLLLNGIKSAFLPQEDKADMIREMVATVVSLRDKFGLDDMEIG
ncbi:adenosine deaminase [bacterium]|nr:adenosine deaminase [bacterium]